MRGELSGGSLQKVRVMRLGVREVALLEVRVPGETLHVVVAEGLGVGLLGPPERARLKEAMAGAAKPGGTSPDIGGSTAVCSTAGTDAGRSSRNSGPVSRVAASGSGCPSGGTPPKGWPGPLWSATGGMY